MKKVPNIVAYLLFTLGYIIFLSLGMACLLFVSSGAFAASPDGTVSYPRFLPFCLMVGVCCTIALCVLLFVNWLVAQDYGYTKEGCGLQAIIVFVLSLCLTQPWVMFLEFLHRIF